jgi:hypothetical protein
VNFPSNSSNYNTILFSSQESGASSAGNNGNYNTISNNKIYNGYFGITVVGYSTSNPSIGNIIKKNQFYDQYNYGIQCYYSSGSVIDSNYIRMDATNTSSYGLYVYYSTKTIISNNDISVGRYGMYLYQENYNSSSDSSWVYNNMIHSFNNTSYQIGIYTYYNYNIQILHNSIFANGSTSSSSNSCLYIYYSYYINIYNNVIVNKNYSYSIYLNNSYYNNLDYNNYYSTSQRMFYFGGNYFDLASFQAANTSYTNNPHDVNSYSFDPGFVSDSNLHATSKNLNNKGMPTIVSKDIDGDPRHPVTPAIGADEVPPENYDVSISKILSPELPLCSSNASVKVEIYNLGKTTLTSDTIRWEVNGVAQTPAVWTGSLALNNTDTFTIGSYNFSPGISYDIRIYGSYINGLYKDQDASNDTAEIVNVRMGMTGTFTVGGSNPDYSGLDSAIIALNNGGLCGPVTFNVRSGNYNQQIDVGKFAGLSSTNTLTIQKDPNDTGNAVFYYAAANSAENFVLRFQDTRHITVKNLTLETRGTGYSSVVIFVGNNDSILLDSNQLIGYNSPTTGNNATVILNDNTSGSNVNYIRITNNLIANGYSGIYWRANSNFQNNNTYISGNTIRDFSTSAIYAYYSSSIYISQNKISVNNSKSYNSTSGIEVNYNTGDLEITKNDIEIGSGYGSNLHGIDILYSYGSAANKYKVNNNFVNITKWSGTPNIYGIRSYYSTYMNVDHNSVNIVEGTNTNTNSYSYYFYYYSTGNCNFRKNISSNNAGGIALHLSNYSIVDTIDYNVYYNNGSVFGYWSFNIADFNSWKTTTSYDSNSIFINPNFNSVNDLRHNNHKLNIGGGSIGVSDDIDGVARSYYTPGAYELLPAQYDVALEKMVSPANPFCGGTSNVSVTLSNFGQTTLTSDTIYWSVNGVTQNPYYWTGSLSYGQSANVVLGTFNFSQGTSYSIEVIPGLINGTNSDQNKANDSLSIKNFITALNGTYTLGGTNPDFSNFSSLISTLNTRGVCGPVTINVRSGKYNEQVLFESVLGSSVANHITIQSDPANTSKPELSFSSTNYDDNYVVRFSNTGHITLKGLEISATSPSYGHVIEFSKNVDSIILDSNIINGYYMTYYGGDNYYVIYKQSATQDDDSFRNVIITNNIIKYGHGAIMLSSYNSTVKKNGVIISNNYIDSFFYSGIEGRSGFTGLTIQENIIEGARNTSYSQYGIYLYDARGGHDISKNRIRLYDQSVIYGIFLSNCYGTATEQQNVYNNYISIQNNSTNSSYGIYDDNCSYTNYYHNTINNSAGTANSGGYAFYANGYSYSYNQLVNNIIASFNGNGAIYLSDTSYYSKISNNAYYVSGNTFGYVNYNNVVSFADWKQNVLYDSNSIFANPGFLSYTDLSHKNFMLNNGISLTSVQKDINDTVRITPTIGAFELLAENYDMATIDLTEPKVGFCGGNSPVKAVIINFGKNTITSDTIYWSINNVAQTPYYWTGSLAQNKSDTIQLGTYNFSGSSYDIVINNGKLLNGSFQDQVSNNDTLSIKGFRTALSGNYSIGGSSADFSDVISAVNALKSYGICGAVVFNISPGTYTGRIELNNIIGLNATNTLTFKGADRENTIIDFTSTGNGDYATVLIDNSKHITFRNLTINAKNPTYAIAVAIIGESDSNTIDNCKLTLPKSTASSLAGILVSESETNFSYNSHTTSNLKISNNIFKYGYYGIRLNGVSTSQLGVSNVIENNYFIDQHYYSVYYYYQKSIELKNNIIKTGYSNYGNFGVYAYYSVASKIYNNDVSAGQYGIYVYRENYYSQSDSSWIFNNLIHNFKYPNYQIGIQNYYGYNVQFLHNTVKLNGTSNGYSYACFYNYYSYNTNILNNIFLSYNQQFLVSNYYGSNTHFDYNLYYSDETGNRYYSSSFSTNLNDFRSNTSSMTTNHDINSVEGIEPIFLSDTNLRVVNNNINNLGSYAGIDFDIDGEVRDTTNGVDVGADEFEINGLAGEYIIDINGNGDFTSFSQAIDTLKKYGVFYSVNFRVKQGTYNEQFEIPYIKGTDSAKRVTFQSFTGDPTDVKVVYAPTASTSNYVVKINGTDYIGFEDITFQNNSSSGFGRVIDFANGATFNHFEGNVFEGIAINSTSDAYALVYSAPGAASKDTSNTFYENEFKYGSYGIYAFGVGIAALEDELFIIDNTFTGQHYGAIYLKYFDAPSILGNEIFATSQHANYIGIYAEFCDNNLKIHQNKIEATNQYLVYIKNSDGTSSEPGVIANNFLIMDQPLALSTGLYLDASSYQYVYFNSSNLESTIYVNARNFTIGGGCSNIDLKNNNFVNNAQGYVLWSLVNTGVSSDYNNFYSNGTNLGNWNSTNYSTLTSWTTATGLDSNSVSVDPQFIKPNNLHIDKKELDSAGIPIAFIETDIDNNQRNATHPDIGADEFTVIANKVSTFPFVENFDNFPQGSGSCGAINPTANGWVNATNDDIDWSADDYTTGSSSTGPSKDHTTGDGKYMYTEASGCYSRKAFLGITSVRLR